MLRLILSADMRLYVQDWSKILCRPEKKKNVWQSRRVMFRLIRCSKWSNRPLARPFLFDVVPSKSNDLHAIELKTEISQCRSPAIIFLSLNPKLIFEIDETKIFCHGKTRPGHILFFKYYKKSSRLNYHGGRIVSLIFHLISVLVWYFISFFVVFYM